MELKRQLGLPTAIFVVVASMIGTGIFITTGSVLKMTNDASLLLLLWAIGGITALTGALCYAELAAMWPDVGGEYVYLRNTFGLLPSFLTGWISLVVGFSASVATSSLSLVKYLEQFCRTVLSGQSAITGALADPWGQKIIAAAAIFILGSFHILGVRRGGRIQNVLTVIKLLIVLSFIGFGVFMADWALSGRLVAGYSAHGADSGPGIPVIGLALLIIMFSYSGWNGAAYIAGEINEPEKNLPRALFFGTLITTLVYIGLNIVFLVSTPGKDLMGQDAVAAVAAKSLFGPGATTLITLCISLILLSSISVQLMIGPRVYYSMAKDKMIFPQLANVNSRLGTPVIAICVQMALSIFYVLIGSASKLMEYMGFALGIFPLLTVIGLVYLRIKHPELKRPYRVPLFPLVPIIYIGFTLCMMIAGFMAWTSTSWFALAVVAAGIPVFYLWRTIAGKSNSDNAH